jgi:hypothetical protein
MVEEPTIEALGDHTFALHARDPDGGVVDVRIYGSADVLTRLGALDPRDEHRVVQATTAYLLARQRADELPPFLELDDVAAAYDGYIADLEDRLESEGRADQ